MGQLDRCPSLSCTVGHPSQSHPYQSQPSRPIVAPKGGWTTAPLLAQCPPSKATFCLAAWKTCYTLSLPKLQMAPFLVKFKGWFSVFATGFATGCHWYIATCSKFDFYAEIQQTFWLIGESWAFWCRFKNDRDLTSCLVLQKSGVVSDRKIADFGSPVQTGFYLFPALTSTLMAFPLPRISRLWTQGTQNTTRVGTWKTTRLGKFFNYGNPQKDWQATPYWNSGDMMCFSTFWGGAKRMKCGLWSPNW